MSGFNAAFLHAFVNTIAARYEAMKIKAESTSEMALVRIGTALAQVNTYIQQNFKTKKVGNVHGRKSNNDRAADLGRQHANSVSLNTNLIKAKPAEKERLALGSGN